MSGGNNWLYGVDISNYQGTPDFDKLKTAKDFVMIKVSEGIGFADGQFKRNRDEARRVGLKRVYYHFAHPDLGNSPINEVNYFLGIINDLQEGELLALDMEVSYNGDYGLWCKDFFNVIKSRYNGHKALLYSNLAIINTHNWAEVWQNSDNGLWIASWDNNPSVIPATQWPVTTMKQYSDKGSVSGINGNVDFDVFYGDATIWSKYAYHPAAPPQPTPDPCGEVKKQNEVLQSENKALQSKLDQVKVIVNS